MREGRSINRLVGLILVTIVLLVFPLGVGCQHEPEIPVVVDFMATPTSGDAPLTVQFTDQSTGSISDWWWFFGDGQTSREQNPSHTYTGDGVYSVCLVAIVRGEPQTMTKDDYIRVGSQAPGWRLTVVGGGTGNIELPPESVIERNQQFIVLDLAGEGIIYWAEFAVKDEAEIEWGVTEQYEHSIYVDGDECYGIIDQVIEIWNFQQKRVRRPDAFYPTIFSKGGDTTACAFWRVNIPFHHSLVFTLENNDDWGTVLVVRASIVYGLVTSGVPGKGTLAQLGQQWSIKKVNEELGFPAAPKIKAALEEHFGKNVFSVAIVSGRTKEALEYYKVLYVDAPEIERDEIRDFLRLNGFIELAYEIENVVSTVDSTLGEGIVPHHSQAWSIKKVSEELGFPAAPKIKAALEEHFGKNVFSVAIVSYQNLETLEYYTVLYVDAPEIERDEIRDFLVREGFIELAYELK